MWNTRWWSVRGCHAADSVRLPPSYIRRTLGCRRRKQGRPRSQSFPPLVRTHAAHNRSRQWATLNYSGGGSANTTPLTLDRESMNTCTSTHTALYLFECYICLKNLELFFFLSCWFWITKGPFVPFRTFRDDLLSPLTFLSKYCGKSSKKINKYELI